MTISSILINYYSHLKIAVDIFVNLVKNLGYFLFQHLVTLQFSPLAGFGTIISWTVVLIKQLQRVRSWNNQAWSSLVKGDEGCFGQSGKLCCLWQPGPPQKNCNPDDSILGDTNAIAFAFEKNHPCRSSLGHHERFHSVQHLSIQAFDRILIAL